MVNNQTYVTLLCTDDYTNGVVYLNENLKRVGAKYPLKCLVDETISEQALEVLKLNGIETIMKPLIPVPEVIKERNKSKGMGIWNTIFQKLWIFALTEYSKVVYLDSDIMVCANVDELFDKPHMSCVQDSAKILHIPEWEGFTEINAGVLVVEPDQMVFNEMIRMISLQALRPLTGTIRDIYCDQRVIDDYYYGWKDLPHLHLGVEYNTFFAYLGRYEELDNKNIKILHLAGGSAETIKFFLPNYNMAYLDKLSDQMYKFAIVYLTNFGKLKHKLTPIKLSIIVPHYKETKEVIRPLFDSLNNQKGINFKELEVVFCDDDGLLISDIWFSQFGNLNIKRVRQEANVGVAMNRQSGLSEAKGKYIMFIDCDDCLFSFITLNRVFQVLRDYPNTSIYKGRYMSETMIEGTDKYNYQSCEGITHFHGKIYNKEFIDKYGLKFYPDCKVNEDTYWNGIAFMLDPKIVEINEPLAIWTHRPDSLSRINNHEITFTGHIDYIKSRHITLDFLYGKIDNNLWIGKLIEFLVIFYFDAQGVNWNECYINRPDLLNEIDEWLYQFYMKYEQFINKIDQREFIMHYNLIRVENYKGADYIERETYYDFWDRIKEKHNLREVNK
jgi:glycogenin glucosyltransferase